MYIHITSSLWIYYGSSDSLSGKSVSARVHAKVEAELAGVRKKLKDAQERNTLLERKVRQSVLFYCQQVQCMCK